MLNKGTGLLVLVSVPGTLEVLQACQGEFHRGYDTGCRIGNLLPASTTIVLYLYLINRGLSVCTTSDEINETER